MYPWILKLDKQNVEYMYEVSLRIIDELIVVANNVQISAF